MSERNFMDMLKARWAEGKSVCVGLDSDVSRMPEPLKEMTDSVAQTAFNLAIIQATHDLVCAFKPNVAFYPGGNGKYVLRDTVRAINEIAPGVPVILDAKQGDIGNTNNGYVLDDFKFIGADAVTVHNYLGAEAMEPFLADANKGIIVLCRTSNPGAAEFQNLMCDVFEGEHEVYVRPEDKVGLLGSMDIGIIKQMPLYQVVAGNIAKKWNYNGNCAVVVGATYPDELAEVRGIVGDMPILIPGIGAQGGELEATVKAGANSLGQGMIINSSRGIIFASSGEDFAQAARVETLKLHQGITDVLSTVER